MRDTETQKERAGSLGAGAYHSPPSHFNTGDKVTLGKPTNLSKPQCFDRKTRTEFRAEGIRWDGEGGSLLHTASSQESLASEAKMSTVSSLTTPACTRSEC